MKRGAIRGTIARARSAFKLTSLQLNENDIEKACMDVLKVRGWKPTKIHCGRFRTPDLKRWITGEPPGTPDYLVVHKLHPAFYLETKRSGAQLTDMQRYRVWEIQRGYGIAFLKADSARALSEWLDRHERSTILTGH
jgi:hypothetical protein